MICIHFLDTCIFFAYSYSWEKDNSTTKKIFENGEKIVTSHTTINEIEIRKSKRKKYYLGLSKYISSGSSIDTFEPDFYLSDNDKRHIEQFKNEVKRQCRNQTEIITFIRYFITLVDKKIFHCRSKLEDIVPSGDDFTLEVALSAILNNRNDAKILVDAVVWSENVVIHKPYFVTLDYTDIIRNRPQLYTFIKNQRNKDPHPLEIVHLRDAI